MTEDLAPSLWTPEDIVAIYRRLLRYCAEHPEDSSPRLEAMYRQRLAQAERDALREQTERRELVLKRGAASRVHPVMQEILDTVIVGRPR
jgi:hypothetical protein